MGKHDFKRNFIVLDQEMRGGLREDTGITGFIRIDVSGRSGQMICNIRGIEKGNDFEYLLYIIPKEKLQAEPFVVGTISVADSSGQLLYKFDAEDVNKSGIGIDDFDAFVVTAYRPEMNAGNEEKICALVGFRRNPFDWRAKFHKSSVAGEKNGGKKIRQVIAIDDDDSLENKSEHYVGSYMDVENDKKNAADKITTEQDEQREQEEQYEQNGEYEQDGQREEEQREQNKQREEKERKSEEEHITCNTNCPDMQYQCSTCAFYPAYAIDKNIPNDVCGEERNIENLNSVFETYFTPYKPFEWGTRGYKWWKIINPAHLSNALYNFNIKTSFLYGAEATTAFNKYRHIIAGMYKSRKNNQYVVFGIPSTFGVDKRPLGEYARWMPVIYKRPWTGDFGYWVVYIDLSTGSISK